MTQYNVSLEFAIASAEVDAAALAGLARRVMAGEGVAEGSALSILVTGDEEMRSLNRDFLGIDEPTDVLSFPDEAGAMVQAAAAEPLLGDIAIGLPIARRQAEEIGHPLAAELEHLLVHGILHLCGYDHESGGAEEVRMREREEHYLGAPMLGHSGQQ